MRMDPRVAAVWLGCSVGVTIVGDHPALCLLVICSAVAVGAAGDRPAAMRMMLIVGAGALAMRVVLFSLTGNGPAPYAFSLPSLRIGWGEGALELGGPVSTQIVGAAVSEGLTIMAVVASFGAFSASVRSVDLLAMLPSRLFEAGLVLNIALTFAPSIGRSVSQVREAQLVRARGRVGVRDVAMPVLAGALERSLTLAESMESRGFGRGPRTAYRRRRPRRGDRAVAICAAGALALAWWSTNTDVLALGSSALAIAALLAIPSVVAFVRSDP